MKRVLLLVLLFLSVARPSIAEQFPGFLAIGAGTLSADDNVSVFVNVNTGQRISLIGAGLDFNSTEGFCGLGRQGAPPGTLLISGSSKRLISITAPVSDLYLYLCIKRSGLSGEFATAILDGNVHPGAAASNEDNVALLEAIVREAIDRRFGR